MNQEKFLLKLRNNEYLKQNNIDLSLSWSKVIQSIKKSFTDDIIYKILNDTSYHKGKIKKKFVKKKKLIKTDITNINNNNENEKELDTNNDSEIIFSTTSENSFSFDDKKENSNDFLYYQMENIPQKNSNINYNNKDYIRDFIQNFNKKTLNDSDFNINVSNIYYNNSAILSINSIKKNYSNEKRENLSFSLNEI